MKSSELFPSTTSFKLVYVFEINDSAHRGLLKVGDTVIHTDVTIDKLPAGCSALNKAAHERIKSYTNTAGVTYNLLYTELAVRQINKNGEVILKSFRDNDVQSVLVNSGIDKVKVGSTTGKEWFRVDLATVKKAIAAVKEGRPNISGMGSGRSKTPIVFRPEQEDAIGMTMEQFSVSNRMLWNAKMRFGKTLTALEVVRRMGFEKTIIMTHRPVVDAGWFEDFNKIFDAGSGYVYGSKGTGASLKQLLKGKKPFVYFASIQDLRGSKKIGGKFDKNDEVFKTVWDCVIVDEAHEGTQTSLGDETVKAVVKENLGKTKFLALSGTPFNILKDYSSSEVYTWDYVMEQDAKNSWWKTHFGDSNPYEDLPELRIFTYDLGDVFPSSRYSGGEDVAFNFREFFRTWTGDFKLDHAEMPENAAVGDFVHEGDVVSFLNLMTSETETSAYPFSTEEYRDMFRHSLWMVPGVRDARALSALMKKHPVFGSGAFQIVNVAGDGDDEDEEDRDALKKVLGAIEKADKLGNYTITLSCGRLTTGVTVKEWSAVLMLSGSYSTSAANYLQTIFRVQSPGQINGKAKECAYAFDFAPDRTLKMVVDAVKASTKPGTTTEGDRERLGKFLNFCPVIGLSGSEMSKYDTSQLLQQLKRSYANNVVRHGFDDQSLYSDELYKLTDGDLSAFEKLKAIVGASKPSKSVDDIEVNKQGLTDEEYEKLEKAKKKPKKELTQEEKELLEKRKRAKQNRDNAISILRQVSVRMPVLIYGANTPYDADITLDQFVSLVDDASWEEFMPRGVTKLMFQEFKRFYDEDVFIAAGRRIRDIAHHADVLDPTERVKEIAGLFSYFKNPDKETVLTPWRVVNMQLSDTLGGWDFFDELHETALDEPRFVDRSVVTNAVFRTAGTRILEINSKTGLYPLYVTYSVYRSRAAWNSHEMDIDERRALWKQTVGENVFVVCKTPMAKTITKRTLLGYGEGQINAHAFDDLLGMIRNKPQQFIDRVRRPWYWGVGGKMAIEFSAVVGNPPYQRDDGGNGVSASPVYQDFVQAAIKLNPQYVSMITPSRWFAGGKGLDDFRETMLSDHRVSRIVDFPKLYEPFPDVKIRGGISYFLWDRDYDGPCEFQTVQDGKPAGQPVKRYLDEYDVLVRRNEAVSILKKVVEKNESNLGERVSSRKPFGLPTNYSNGKDSPDGMADPVQLYANQQIVWTERSEIATNDGWIDLWKVLVTCVQGTSAAVETKFLSKPVIAGPGTACTETYLVAGRFESRQEAENFASYLRTRFVRFLISLRKSTQHATRKVYAFVPDVSYDHPWTDKMLYDRYGITPSEVAFIESIVSPLE